MKILLSGLLTISSLFVNAQALPADTINLTADQTKPKEAKSKKWYDVINVKGYAQVRYNRVLETNPDLECDQCDKSIGDKAGFFIRRARLVFSGTPHERVFFYFQPDFASNVANDKQHFLQVRDLYFDVSLDKKSEYRVRIGQSKVPFGFENLQSSSNRLSFDRADPLNSAVPNERDLGVYFFWTPKKVQEKFKELQNHQLKGTGNYGLLAIGAYNGQSANVQESNNNQHLVVRLAYPARIGNQTIEGGIHAYAGRFIINKNNKLTGTNEFKDQRYGANFILYPKPLGIQAEWNQGKGPSFDPNDSTVKESNLKGGYAQIMYNLSFGKQFLIPYAKYQIYDGGKKHEQDARYYNINEWEFGMEWQPIKYLEFTAGYAIMDRTYEDYSNPDNRQKGNLLRLQAQLNF